MAIPTSRPVERIPTEVTGPTDLTRLHAMLFEQIGEAGNSDEAIQGLLRAARELTNAAAVCYFREPPGPTSPPVQTDWPEKSPADVRTVLSRVGTRLPRVFDEQRVQIVQVDDNSDWHAILVPVIHIDGTTHVLAAVLMIGDEPLESFVVILQLIAGYSTLFSQRMWNVQIDWEARGAAAILELTNRILVAPTLRSASFEIVDLIQQFLGVTEVVVGRKQRHASRLEAVSGQANVSLASELAGQYVAVLDEAFVKQEASSWSVDSARPTTEAQRQLTLSRRANFVYSAPLAPLDDDAYWGWIILADQPLEPHVVRWLHAAGPHVAASLLAVSKRRRGLRGQLASHRAWLALAGLLALCLFLPAPFPVSGDCVAQPLTRRFVAAPFDGTLLTTSARPGDVVAENEVLATLDDRDLRSQLTEAIAQRASAETRATASLARKDVTEAQLARLETERLTMRIDLVQRYLEEIEITSPFDGIVLSGDWQQASGMPLRVGQTLFEIAPLSRMRVEIDIGEDDIAWVTEGTAVDLWFDAISQAYHGTIERVRPRSEIRDGMNVFVAEVSIDNEQDTLRPGLGGIARIRAGTRPLGWILFRKPWYVMRRLLWW